MKSFFEFPGVQYNLRNQSECNCSILGTERCSIETASSIRFKTIGQIPREIKNSKSLAKFKVRIQS